MKRLTNFFGKIVPLLLATFLLFQTQEALAYSLQSLPLQSGENNLFSSVIDSEGGFAYFGTNSWPCRVVKIKLADFTRFDSLSVPTITGCNLLNSATIDKANGYAYFTIGNINPGSIIRVRLSDFTIDGILRLSPGQARTLTLDQKNKLLYVGTAPPSGKSNQGRVIKIDLNSFTEIDSINLLSGLQWPDSAMIDPQSKFLLLAVDSQEGPGAITKIDLQTFTVGNTLMFPGQDESPVTGAIDFNGEFAYIGMEKPHVYKIRVSDLFILKRIYVNSSGFGFRSSSISSSGLFAYFMTSTGCRGAKLFMINLSNFQATGSLQITPNNVGIATMSVDPQTNNIYMGDLFCRSTEDGGNIYKLSH